MKKIRHSHRLQIGSLEALEGRTLLSVAAPARQAFAPSAAIARVEAPRSAGPHMTWKNFGGAPTAQVALTAVPAADAATPAADTPAPTADVPAPTDDAAALAADAAP